MSETQDQLRAELLRLQAEERRREINYRLAIRDSKEAVRFHQRLTRSEEYEIDDHYED